MHDLVIGFTSPQSGKANTAIGTLAMSFLTGVLSRLSKRVSADPVAEALFRTSVAPNVGLLPHSSLCWLPEAGSALRCMSANDVRPAVIHALFAMHSLQLAGCWSIGLDAPLRVTFAGYAFTLEGDVAVSATASAFHVACDCGARSLRFSWTADGWRLEGGDDAIWFDCVVPERIDFDGYRDKYIQGWREPSDPGLIDLIVEWPPSRLEGPDAGIPAIAAKLALEAVTLLDDLGPHYLSWIAPLFRGIAASPLTAPDMMQSGSYTWHPGVFSSGFPIGPEALGELIVHEVSHQHFLLMNATIPLVDRTNAQTFFSSLKGLDRRLDRIVLGYHATANMSLYWKDVIEKHGVTPRREHSLKKMYGHTQDLAHELARAGGFTAAGRTFVESHAQILRDHDLPLEAFETGLAATG